VGITIYPYHDLNNPYEYVPPKEIQLLVGEGVRTELMKVLGTLDLAQKLLGYIVNNSNVMTPHLTKHATPAVLAELKKHDFNSSDEVFNYNYERVQFGDEDCSLAPCDGFFSHQRIYKENDVLESQLFNAIDIDVLKMLGMKEDIMSKVMHSYTKEEVLSLADETSKIIDDLEGGYHDLFILKPEDKHVISIPMESSLKMSYRIDRDGSLHSVAIHTPIVGKGKTFSTDPYYAIKNPDESIIDGNPRMVFILTTNIDGEDIDYIMIAHSAAFVRGVESLVEHGDSFSPGDNILKFHFGSSISVIYPKQLLKYRQLVPGLENKTRDGSLLKVQEGEVLYLPQELSQGETVQVNPNKHISIGSDGAINIS